MNILNVAADFGASLVKAVYCNSSNQPCLILLKPEMISVPSSAIEAYKNGLGYGSSSPEETAWVKVKDEYFVLGESARHRFQVQTHLRQPKYSKAVYQCLALVGSAIQKQKQIPSTLNLATLLPFDEFCHKDQFIKEVRELLSNFTFRGKSYSVKVDKILCVPEGSGLYLRGRKLWRTELGNLANDDDITTVILMMGYRNISLMVMDEGVPKVKETTFQGFAQMLRLIKERVPVLNEQALIKGISQSTAKQRKKALEKIAVSHDSTIKKQETEKLLSVIDDAKKEYFNIVTNFLNDHLSSFSVDEFVIGGGTAYYLRNELDKYLQGWEVQISWGFPLEWRIGKIFGEMIKRKSLEYRLCDVYGLFYFLLGQPLPEIQIKR